MTSGRCGHGASKYLPPVPSFSHQYMMCQPSMLQHCTMCSLDSFFSFRPNEVRHVVKFHGYIAIEHILIPARSVERKIEKIGFS